MTKNTFNNNHIQEDNVQFISVAFNRVTSSINGSNFIYKQQIASFTCNQAIICYLPTLIKIWEMFFSFKDSIFRHIQSVYECTCLIFTFNIFQVSEMEMENIKAQAWREFVFFNNPLIKVEEFKFL